MFKKMSKEDRKVMRGLIAKVLKFVGTLDPGEIMFLSKIITSLIGPKIELDDDDE